MKIRGLLLATTVALAIAILPVSAQVLTGQVTSAEEGNMEGVVVTAKKAGSTISVSVVSDAQGRFSFPAAKLEPGQYSLRIRAIGFELDGPRTAEVAAQTAPISIKLRKARNLAAQLTSSEWFMSFPGDRAQKVFMDRCTSCHTYERIAKSTYDAGQPSTLLSMGFDSLTIDPAAARDLLMFRLAENITTIIVHERIKKAIEAARIPLINVDPTTDVALL